MTTPPAVNRKVAINNVVAALKTASVWTKLAALYVLAAADAQAASINWLAPSGTKLTATVAPTFTADRGYVGNGSTQFLTTGIALNAAAPYAQNDCHMGAWIGTDASGATAYDCGTTVAALNSRSGSDARFRPQHNAHLNKTLASLGGSATAIGHSLWCRSGAGAWHAQKNGGAVVTGTEASVALTADVVFICAWNSGGTAANYSARRQQALHFGSALTEAEGLAVYNALNAYMTILGAV
jgi:hypothetical protein